jgi:moderate conductance mechanosensitive channel
VLAVVAATDPELVEGCGVDPGWICRTAFEVTGDPDAADAIDWLVTRPLSAALVLLIAWLVNRFVRRAIDRLVRRVVIERDRLHDAVRSGTDRQRWAERTQQRTATLTVVLRSIAAAIIYTTGFLVALDQLQVDLGPFIPGASVAGVALGFGAQQIVRDFLAGLFIIVEDQYGVGDEIDLGEPRGLVEAVTLRATRIRDVNGTLWTIGNGEIRKVGNRTQQWARVVLDIDVPYESDLEQAAAAIKAAADEVWHEEREGKLILEEPAVWGVQEFRRDGVVLRLAVKTRPGHQFATAREIRGRLKRQFAAHRVAIAETDDTTDEHRDVHSGGADEPESEG